MNDRATERIGAAREALRSRLEQLLPGDGELTVDARPMVGEVVFHCRRSTRIGTVCLAVPTNIKGEGLVASALEELAETQLDALEALPSAIRATGAA